ncbi:helix-turn-helix domain-containing protein [Staphylococcus epidermidis]|nr:helix-turn-helix domain-containing protein [Staphylococcus epidermidis]
MSFIKVERSKRAWRQQDLAENTGIPASKLYRGEGKNILEYFNYVELEKLARGLNMTVDELVKLYRTEYLKKGEI